jgi:hypothetical protein
LNHADSDVTTEEDGDALYHKEDEVWPIQSVSGSLQQLDFEVRGNNVDVQCFFADGVQEFGVLTERTEFVNQRNRECTSQKAYGIAIKVYTELSEHIFSYQTMSRRVNKAFGSEEIKRGAE